ncbi:hypothetical protein ABFW39_002838 [Listeria monocytogenes]|nr:hypothetical protein [Listeria monocytogenes]EHM3340493.1 hypothetical protein [Listeria monocytogenes]EHM3395533.1 hypothetical protein [Listeria monocytogenes]
MDLLFECLFKKIERANQKIIRSLIKERYSAKLGEEILGLNSLLDDVQQEVKYAYYTDVSIEVKDKVKFNEELKKVQLLLYAVRITQWNLESYTKYFETKDESLLIWKEIMFMDELDVPGGLNSTTIKAIIFDGNKAKQFYKPLGYCDVKVSIDDETYNLISYRVQDLMNAIGIVDIDAKEYLEKWNIAFFQID